LECRIIFSVHEKIVLMPEVYLEIDDEGFQNEARGTYLGLLGKFADDIAVLSGRAEFYARTRAAGSWNTSAASQGTTQPCQSNGLSAEPLLCRLGMPVDEHLR
jgi:hypothetical protein